MSYKRIITLIVFALATSALQLAAQAQDTPLCEQAFTVAALGSRDCVVIVSEKMQSGQIEGHFRATGGPHNSIEVWVLDDDGYVNWKNHHHVTALYNSRRVTQGSIDVALAHPGKYHVVFNNEFSVITPKAVEAQIVLQHKRLLVPTSN